MSEHFKKSRERQEKANTARALAKHDWRGHNMHSEMIGWFGCIRINSTDQISIHMASAFSVGLHLPCGIQPIPNVLLNGAVERLFLDIQSFFLHG